MTWLILPRSRSSSWPAGFMAAKHLFIANEIGLFAALADGPAPLDRLAELTGIARPRVRILADALVTLGLIERQGDQYQNGPVAAAFLSGTGPADLRPFLRFWNHISYPLWTKLEDTVRTGQGQQGMTLPENRSGSIWKGSRRSWQGQPRPSRPPTTFAAIVACSTSGAGSGHGSLPSYGTTPCWRERCSTCRTPPRSPVSASPVIPASSGRRWWPETSSQTPFRVATTPCSSPTSCTSILRPIILSCLRRTRAHVPDGARLLLADWWTDATHTQPPMAALMAGEFLVFSGEGDVYSEEEAQRLAAREWVAGHGAQALGGSTQPAGGRDGSVMTREGTPGAASVCPRPARGSKNSGAESRPLPMPNEGMQATAYSVRSSLAPAARRGSCPVFGVILGRGKQMSGPLHIIYEGSEGRILVTDSCTYCDERVKTTDVIIAGSFAGEVAAAMALRRGARAFLGNAAGIGLDGAGVSGLTLGQRLGTPAAALSEQSARLGDGPDGYAQGVIARVNELARGLGVREDMSCAEAAALLLKAPLGVVAAATHTSTIIARSSTTDQRVRSPPWSQCPLRRAEMLARSSVRVPTRPPSPGTTSPHTAFRSRGSSATMRSRQGPFGHSRLESPEQGRHSRRVCRGNVRAHRQRQKYLRTRHYLALQRCGTGTGCPARPTGERSLSGAAEGLSRGKVAEKRGSVTRPFSRRTHRCRRRPTAYATLQLPDAAEWRC